MKETNHLIHSRKNKVRTIVEAIKGKTVSQIINYGKIKIEDNTYIHRIIIVVSHKFRTKGLEITGVLLLTIHQDIIINQIAAFRTEENLTLFLEDRGDQKIITVVALMSPVHFAGGEVIQKISAAKSKSVSIIQDLDTQY